MADRFCRSFDRSACAHSRGARGTVLGQQTNVVALARETNRSTVAWDYIAVYAPGALWKDAPPKPAYSDSPVRDVISGAKASTQRFLASDNNAAGGEK